MGRIVKRRACWIPNPTAHSKNAFKQQLQMLNVSTTRSAYACYGTQLLHLVRIHEETFRYELQASEIRKQLTKVINGNKAQTLSSGMISEKQ